MQRFDSIYRALIKLLFFCLSKKPVSIVNAIKHTRVTKDFSHLHPRLLLLSLSLWSLLLQYSTSCLYSAECKKSKHNIHVETKFFFFVTIPAYFATFMDGIYGRSGGVQSNFEQATSRNNPIAFSRASENISCPSTSYFLVGVRAFMVSLSNKWLTFCTAAQACPRRWSQTKERELEVHRGISAKTHQNAWIVTQAVGRRPARGLSRFYKARRSTPTCRHSSSVPCNT